MLKFVSLLLLAAAATVDAQFGLPNPVNTVTNAGRTLTTPLAQITSHIASQQGQLGTILGVDANAQLSTLFAGAGNLAPAELAKCYNSTMGGNSLNIFENSPFDIITAYYKEFPENFDISRFQEKVGNLFKTLTEIVTRSVECVGKPDMQSFKVGLNKLSDFSAAEFTKLMGALPDPQMGNKYRNRPKYSDEDPDAENTRPASNNRRGGSGSLGGLFRSKRSDAVPIDPKCFPKSTAVPASLDYRSTGRVTPVRYQGTCGSCWAFASIAALESAYLIQGKASGTPEEFDLSEQQLVACANQNFCNGGTSVDAYNFLLLNKGVTGEKIMGYDNNQKQCVTKKKKRQAKIKDYCLRGIYAEVNGAPEVLTDEQIQAAIKEFGVVYTTLYGETPELKNYKSGVFDQPGCSKETNHAVNIVGWDKNYWLVRNSWGKKWGEDGFFRLKRGENMCGINTYITYPLLA